MNRQLAAGVAFVAVVCLGAAYGLVLFEASAPSTPAARATATPAASADALVDPAKTSTPAPVREPSPPAARASAAPADAPPASLDGPRTATLRIDTDVPGADVFIDNQFAGKAPATIADVQPGRRKISVSATGYETIGEFHDVSPGTRDIVISLRTIRLDRRMTVTHRHRLGSCSGTLIATPAGLRYETSRTEDAFRAHLLDLETFKADYLNKNLEVEIRGGRSYNFTDPSGKADDLYQFHQDVEKVRQRLLKEGGRDGI